MTIVNHGRGGRRDTAAGCFWGLSIPCTHGGTRRPSKGNWAPSIPGLDVGFGMVTSGLRAPVEGSRSTSRLVCCSATTTVPPTRGTRPSGWLPSTKLRIGAPSEASSNLARFDGVRYGMRAAAATDLLDMYTRTRHDGFGAEVKRRIMLGTYALSSGYYDAYYGRAQRVRTKIAEDFRAAFEEVDFIVTPTAPTVAFRLGEKTGDPLSMYLNDYCTVPMSLAGIPAISIPCGLSAESDGVGPPGGGLPVGLQIAGPAFSENRLLDVAHALERAIGFDGSKARV